MKHIVITGAASGLGWALAQAFHQQGHQLYLVDRDEEGLRRCSEVLGLEPSRLFVADLADRKQRATLAAALTQLSVIDVLVNNAGITHRSLVGVTDPGVFDKVMTIDWLAPVELASALLPQLRASRGSIINIGSMAGWMPVLGRAAYCSAKSALGQFFEVLRAEEDRHGIHVLMVYPAFLNTNIERNALGGDGGQARHARSTLGGVGEAPPLASAILKAWQKRRPHLFPHRGIWAASLLWRIAPGLFHTLMRRRFAVELEQH